MERISWCSFMAMRLAGWLVWGLQWRATDRLLVVVAAVPAAAVALASNKSIDWQLWAITCYSGKIHIITSERNGISGANPCVVLVAAYRSTLLCRYAIPMVVAGGVVAPCQGHKMIRLILTLCLVLSLRSMPLAVCHVGKDNLISQLPPTPPLRCMNKKERVKWAMNYWLDVW